MTARAADDPPGGLLQRKKEATRRNIESAALRLFATQGFDHTTLAQVAHQADVAQRTIFAYFDSKEEIVFAEETRFYGRLEDALRHRPAATTTIETLRGFFESPAIGDAQQRLRGTIIAASKTLRARQRAGSTVMESLLRTAFASDMCAAPDDVLPALAAGAITGGFAAARDQRLDGSGVPLSHEQTTHILEAVLTFARGGLAASHRANEAPDSETAEPTVPKKPRRRRAEPA